MLVLTFFLQSESKAALASSETSSSGRKSPSRSSPSVKTPVGGYFLQVRSQMFLSKKLGSSVKYFVVWVL